MDKLKDITINILKRFSQAVLTPLVIVTMVIIGLSAIISIPIWIFTGKTIISYAVKLGTLHMDYVFGKE